MPKQYLVVKRDKLHLLESYGFKKSDFPNSKTYVYLPKGQKFSDSGFSIIVNPYTGDFTVPENVLIINYYYENRVEESKWVSIDEAECLFIDIIIRLWEDEIIERKEKT